MKYVLAALALAAACSDDVDLTGVYRVDADVASSPCGTDQPIMMPPAYLRLAKDELLGNEYFSLQTCSDAAGTDCAGGGLFGTSFHEPIDGGWRGVMYSASGTTATCDLSYTEHTAVLTSAMLVVDITTYSEQTSDVACTVDEAEARGTTMPCSDHERIDATRL